MFNNKITSSDCDNKCQFCGMIHTGMCPLIKSIEYYESGVIKRISFKDEDFTVINTQKE